MKLLITLLTSLTLTGCATGCYEACLLGFGPGNPIFNAVADSADRKDPCQTRTHSTLTGARLKPDGHVVPDFCNYQSRTRTDIYDRSGRWVGEVRTRNVR